MAIAPAGRTLLPVALDLDFDFGMKSLRLIRGGAGLAAERRKNEAQGASRGISKGARPGGIVDIPDGADG
jgi:hypothetical protein